MKYIGFKNYYEPNLYQEELNEDKDSSINENLSFLDSDNYNIISNKPTSYHDIMNYILWNSKLIILFCLNPLYCNTKKMIIKI